MRLMQDRSWEGCIWTGGSWETGGGSILEIISPASGRVLARGGQASLDDVTLAASQAAGASKVWSSYSGAARANILEKAAEVLIDSIDEVVWWLVHETGSTQGRAEDSVRLTSEKLMSGARIAREMINSVVINTGTRFEQSFAERIAYGVVAVITPWNSPLVLGVRAIAPALAAGNAVVLKPDPRTPVSGGVILAMVFEKAGLPAGVLQVIPGGADVGEALILDPNIAKVSFTGSTAVGRRVGMLAGESLKSISLELGGNNALIVLDDAEVGQAANAGARGSFGHQGQICMATGRHIVHVDVAERYVTTLVELAEKLRVGDPATDKVDIGPLISESQADRVERLVNSSVSAGAVIRTGARREGRFYWPTVLGNVDPSMPVYTEEIFGPVAPVTVVRDEDEAINLANMTSYGLVASVFTSDLVRGGAVLDQLRTGVGHVNDRTVKSDVRAPFGGLGCSGNGSRYGEVADLNEFSTWRWRTIRETSVEKRDSANVVPKSTSERGGKG